MKQILFRILMPAVICFLLENGCIAEDQHFVPPDLEMRNATIVSFQVTEEVEPYFPLELRPVVRLLIARIPKVADYAGEISKQGPSLTDNWRYFHFKLLQDTLFERWYGSEWVDNRGRVLSVVDSIWKVSDDSASVYGDGQIVAELAEFRDAAIRFTDALSSIMDSFPTVHSIFVKSFGQRLLSWYSTSAQESTIYETPRTIIKEFIPYATPGMFADKYSRKMFSHGNAVGIHYFSDTIHLHFAYFPKDSNPYDILVILKSPVPIELSD